MTVTIKIKCNNDAFGDESELPRILRLFANDCEKGISLFGLKEYPLFDINGNKVGSVKVSK